MRPCVLLTAALLLAGPAAAASADIADPVVLELFTSQGCSSCPPADALLRELAARPDVLPLAFHVTYWDRLGWRDPFSLAEATARQRRHAATLGLPTIYTPQAVVGGRIDVVGSDRAGVQAAIASAARDQRGARVTLARGADGLVLQLAPAAAAPGAATIWLVGYDRLHRTQIAAGENGGRSLTEANVVRAVQDLGPWSGAGVTLRPALPPGERHAVLVQAEDGRIIGAARAD